MIFGPMLRICFNGNVFKGQCGKGYSFIKKCIVYPPRLSSILQHCSSIWRACNSAMSGCFWEPSVLGSSPILNTQTVVYLISDLVSLGAQVKKQLMPSCRNILSFFRTPSNHLRSQGSPHYLTWQPGHCRHVQVWSPESGSSLGTTRVQPMNPMKQSIQSIQGSFKSIQSIQSIWGSKSVLTPNIYIGSNTV